MVQGQVFLKGGGVSFLHLEITLPFAKTVLCIWKKKFFFCHHNFMEKGHSKLS